MMGPQFWIIPVVTALIGWGTNVLAVRMLFRPRRPKRLIFWRLQGVIPRRQVALAGSLAQVFERELLSNEELVARVQGVDLGRDLEPVLDQRIDGFLDRFAEGMPMAKMFLTDSLRSSIATQLKRELLEAMPAVQSQLGQSLSEQVDLRELIEEKVRAFSLERLERLILDVAKRELKAIELLGGVLGFLIGLGQLGLMTWMS